MVTVKEDAKKCQKYTNVPKMTREMSKYEIIS